uniref:FCP1 homology domain-containing protein n=2 Tax=Rhodosorus marinus TaxID=101924 RepID=A0A7S2ZGX5_9RHOD|mmetsp:Transcript_16624/g.68141  ORF Transcript_16624/g.68141 Transcript_16624/m.68141 type:complete len:355 (+) Transcript_16624:235-1299(+)
MSVDENGRGGLRYRWSRRRVRSAGKVLKEDWLSLSGSEIKKKFGRLKREGFIPSEHAFVLKRWFESCLLPFVQLFESMSSAMEIGVPKLGPTAGNSTGEEESALSPPCSSYKIDSVAENEPLVNSATDVNGIRIWNDLDALSFIASLPPLSSILNRPKVCIAPKAPGRPRTTLVLDLDETLVHCSTEALENYDLTFPVKFRDHEYEIFVRRRPHLEEFLAEISKTFEVIVFTASHKVYADRLLDILDPKDAYFDHRVFRESCLFHVGNYIKDLSVLGREISRTVIIDNSPQAFGFHVDNGIPISTWTVEQDDDALLRLMPLLKDVANAPDVRPVIRERVGLGKKITELRELSTA